MLILLIAVGFICVLAAIDRSHNRIDSHYHPDFDEDGSGAGPREGK